MRRFHVGETTEGQLALERRAELVAAVLQLALALQVFALVLLVFAADRAAASLRGAMCGYGVFFSSPWGPRALMASALSAAACGVWLVEHRLDLLARSPVWLRRKFRALFLVAPLVIASAGTSLAFFADLDFGVAASCCSTVFTNRSASIFAGAPLSPPLLAGITAAAVAFALGSSVAFAQKPSAPRGWMTSIGALLACAAGSMTAVWYVAPHVFETPVHTCPFCLVHGPAAVIGWPLFAGLAVGGFSGAMVTWVLRSPVARAEPEAVRAFARKLARVAAFGWIVALLAGAAPVVRYAVVSGGSSLFVGF